MTPLKVGDLVIRSHRLFKTHGTIMRLATVRRGEARQVWVKWHHPHTLPNPSLEEADNIELVVQVAENSPRPATRIDSGSNVESDA